MITSLTRWGTDGPPVVLLHGWTMRGAVWDAVARHLPARALAPDLPGHGATTGYPLSIEGAATQLHDLLTHEDLRDVTLVGWSLGALVGWHYLARNGARVGRMISIDMSPRPMPAPGWAHAMTGLSTANAPRSARRFTTDWPAAARAIARTMLAPGADPALIDRAERMAAANDPATMAAFWSALIQTDLRADIATLPAPLLAIHGARSRVYPPDTANWLASAAPDGRALILPGAGHSPLLETPVALAQAIATLLP
ncbi:MAG: alpha/beta fold hydrolase [Pararhodobacter sp.]